MPLTAEDVKNKQFTPTRFKGGYDEKEVDDFLDEVEAELNRLYRENSDLRARLQVAEQAARQAASMPHPPAGAPGGPGAPGAAPGAPGGPAAGVPVMPQPPAAPQPPVAPPPIAPAPVPSAAGDGGGQGSQEAALRMLAMAQKTADDTSPRPGATPTSCSLTPA